jgi:hypothetical protein
MTDRELLKQWIIEALISLGGRAKVVEISRKIWENHESDLRGHGDLFYTWQYGMRWAGQVLQHEGKLTKGGKDRVWSLT